MISIHSPFSSGLLGSRGRGRATRQRDEGRRDGIAPPGANMSDSRDRGGAVVICPRMGTGGHSASTNGRRRASYALRLRPPLKRDAFTALGSLLVGLAGDRRLLMEGEPPGAVILQDVHARGVGRVGVPAVPPGVGPIGDDRAGVAQVDEVHVLDSNLRPCGGALERLDDRRFVEDSRRLGEDHHRVAGQVLAVVVDAVGVGPEPFLDREQLLLEAHASTAWVCVTRATRRPSSSRRSVSTTIVRLPLCSARAVAWTWPPRTAAKKFVFDSIVAVPAAPSGRLRKASRPPAESARPISAPPWRMPPAVQRLSSQASRAVTSSGPAASHSIPSSAPNGAVSLTLPVRPSSTAPYGSDPCPNGSGGRARASSSSGPSPSSRSCATTRPRRFRRGRSRSWRSSWSPGSPASSRRASPAR